MPSCANVLQPLMLQIERAQNVAKNAYLLKKSLLGTFGHILVFGSNVLKPKYLNVQMSSNHDIPMSKLEKQMYFMRYGSKNHYYDDVCRL